ncbi:MAG: molybdopterin-dependent oxidoreductase [Myxococcota bacterium]|nr:molybdopterin-dependent oxidoreductase [Myxococcota bacterium]
MAAGEDGVHTTFCRICEATCGLEVTVRDGRIAAIAPDRRHVASRGYACVKGMRFAEVQHSPDRILHPMKRVADRWQRISWDEALGEIGAKLRTLAGRHGPNTLAHFMGSPPGASTIGPAIQQAFMQAVGSNQTYGVGSVDCNNKFRVNAELYGSPFRVAYPDVLHSRFVMLIGANPSVSGTSLFHLPHSIQRLKDVAKRGGRVVFVNPRRTETAAAAGEQVFIRPDTDVFFLAAFLRERIGAGVDRARIAAHMTGFEELERVVDAWTPERVEPVTGVPAGVLRGLVAAHAAADGAALYMSTGVNQGRFGTLCFWLMECINAVSGNLDRRGGTLMGRGLYDMAAEGKKRGQFERPDRSPVGGLPSVVDTFPVGLLADEIRKPERERVTALIVWGSNPVLNCPNPNGRLEDALRELELLVAIDLFRNETGELAHYFLPSTSFVERADIPYALQTGAGCQTLRYVQYTDPVLQPPEDVREEWWIYTRLARAMGVRLFPSALASAALQANAALAYSRWGDRLALHSPQLVGLMLRGFEAGSRRSHLRDHPHGMLLSPNQPGSFLGSERVLTPDRKVNLAPGEFVAAATRLDAAYEQELATRGGLKLIGKRERNSINSWMRNAQGLQRDTTNYLYVHPEDAARSDLDEGDRAELRSAHGKIEVPVRISDEVMPGTVALPHGWGHAGATGLRVAREHAGVNSNRLAGDGLENVEPLSGMSHLSGIPVELRRIS